MSIIAALLFGLAFILFLVDGMGWSSRPLTPFGLASLTAGLFCALADNSTQVHF